MNDRELHDLLDAWMDLGPEVAPVRVADAARLEARSTRQAVTLVRWTPPRLPFLNVAALQFALAAVVVIAAALLGYRYLAGSSVGGPGLEDPVPAPTVSSMARPIPLRFSTGNLAPGRYSLAGSFPVELTVDLPAGWFSCSFGVMEQGVCRSPTQDESGIGISFLVVENVVADPCNESLRDPPVGPTVEDLVDAVSSLEGFVASEAVDTTVDGYRAKRLTLTAPDASRCALFTWAAPGRTNGAGQSEINDLHVVDVDGIRILITAAYFPELVTPEDLAAAEEVVASIQIDR